MFAGRPATEALEGEMSWIRTIDPEDATGELAEAYGWQAKRLVGG